MRWFGIKGFRSRGDDKYIQATGVLIGLVSSYMTYTSVISSYPPPSSQNTAPSTPGSPPKA